MFSGKIGSAPCALKKNYFVSFVKELNVTTWKSNWKCWTSVKKHIA